MDVGLLEEFRFDWESDWGFSGKVDVTSTK